MSVRHEGPWHYEFIKQRTEKQWRVSDRDDDPIRSFDTEVEAIEFVGSHNANQSSEPSSWRT